MAAVEPDFIEVRGSQAALEYLRAMCGTPDGEEVLLDRIASDHAVLGLADTMAWLRARFGADEPITLERVKEAFEHMEQELQARDETIRAGQVAQEQMVHTLTKQAVQGKPAEHTIDDCAAMLLSCCPPQVIEAMENAVISLQGYRQPWQIIAGALLMWKNDLVGIDTTEIHEPGVPVRIGSQPYSTPLVHAVSGRQGPSLVGHYPVCEVCEQAFVPGTNDFRPRFGCAVCGQVGSHRTMNAVDAKRAEGNALFTLTLRPTDIREVETQMGLRCTCGQVTALSA